MRRSDAWCITHGPRPKPLRRVSGARRPAVQSRQTSGRISTRKNSLSRPGEGQEGGREHSPSSLTPVTVREAERSYPRRGYRFLPKGKYRSFTDFFPQREIFGSPPCFSFPAKVDEKGEKGRFFQAGFFCGPHIFYAPAVIAAGGRPHGGRGSSPHLPASVRHTIRKKTKGSRAALLSASHRTGSRASTPVLDNLPMKREGRRTNQSVCPPAITPFPPVIPGTSPPSRNQSRRASMQLSPPRSHPRRKAGPSHRRSQSTSWKPAKANPQSPRPRRIPGHPHPR